MGEHGQSKQDIERDSAVSTDPAGHIAFSVVTYIAKYPVAI
jgi:hypothetical protein